jgi:glycolate oxidase iron-sulfur subunit
MSAVQPTLRTLDYSVLQQCVRCGMCLPTCPTYDATHHERNSPRGRISLMRAVADGALEITPAFADEMSYCLGCLACQSACPAGVNYATLFETARNDIEIAGVSRNPRRRFWRAVTLGFLFRYPRALRLLGRLLRFTQRSGLQTVARRSGLTRLLPADLRRLEPRAPAIARVFSDSLIARRETPPGTSRYRVALLTGCIQDLVFPDINRDTADVLLANGCTVDTPSQQPCCGSLHAHNGDLDTATALARQMIDLFPPDDYDAIITNAGGCGSHLRHYASLLANDARYRGAAQTWDRRLRDVHEWLAEIQWRRPLAPPFEAAIRVTYHDSCHLVHGQKIGTQPRAVLSSLPGVSIAELPESTWCCGSAGIYALTQPGQAEALLQRKVGHITSTSAAIVATANPGCHLQIARGLAEAGLPTRVMHPISLLARAYRASRVVAPSNEQRTTSNGQRATI